MFSHHHVSLSVIDLNRSINFYIHFGFKVALIWESDDKKIKIAHLKLKDNLLELFYFTDHTISNSNDNLDKDLSNIGIKHFALKVESIDAAKKFILEKKLATSVEIKEGRTGIKYFFIKDPNNIFLEIVEDHRVFNNHRDPNAT